MRIYGQTSISKLNYNLRSEIKRVLWKKEADRNFAFTH